MGDVLDVRSQSLWLDTYPGDLDPRPTLGGDVQCDVAIVGGGLTGLWTAHSLIERDPTLRIVVVEREVCGFGASGRNGGWAVGELAGSLEKYASQSSMAEALRQLRTMFDTVDEIGRVVDADGIDCGYAHGGVVRLARNDAQARRQRAEVEHHRALGITENELRLLDATEARAMCNATETRSGIFIAAGAAVDPARLVRGLAEVCIRRGVTIHEGTEATSIGDRCVTTLHGTVRADVVVRATEAYTRDLPGLRRALAPIYSLMVATEPLPADVIAQIGLAGRPTFADDRYMVIYGQRTADDRLAFGGRGVPYAYGSAIRPDLERNPGSHQRIVATLRDLFPALGDVDITHRWGGVLGVPRNWMPSVRFDRAAGFATAGGYVGEGVAAANLAGRTLADLIVGAETDLTTLPWVSTRSRKWEPEPLRWLGVRTASSALALADRLENRNRGEARWAAQLSRLLRG